jgi:hypothetical protein
MWGGHSHAMKILAPLLQALVCTGQFGIAPRDEISNETDSEMNDAIYVLWVFGIIVAVPATVVACFGCSVCCPPACVLAPGRLPCCKSLMSRPTVMWLNFSLGSFALCCLILSWTLSWTLESQSKLYGGWNVILNGPPAIAAAFLALCSIITGFALCFTANDSQAAAESRQAVAVEAQVPTPAMPTPAPHNVEVTVPPGMVEGQMIQVQAPVHF